MAWHVDGLDATQCSGIPTNRQRTCALDIHCGDGAFVSSMTDRYLYVNCVTARPNLGNDVELACSSCFMIPVLHGAVGCYVVLLGNCVVACAV